METNSNRSDNTATAKPHDNVIGGGVSGRKRSVSISSSQEQPKQQDNNSFFSYSFIDSNPYNNNENYNGNNSYTSDSNSNSGTAGRRNRQKKQKKNGDLSGSDSHGYSSFSEIEATIEDLGMAVATGITDIQMDTISEDNNGKNMGSGFLGGVGNFGLSVSEADAADSSDIMVTKNHTDSLERDRNSENYSSYDELSDYMYSTDEGDSLLEHLQPKRRHNSSQKERRLSSSLVNEVNIDDNSSGSGRHARIGGKTVIVLGKSEAPLIRLRKNSFSSASGHDSDNGISTGTASPNADTVENPFDRPSLSACRIESNANDGVTGGRKWWWSNDDSWKLAKQIFVPFATALVTSAALSLATGLAASKLDILHDFSRERSSSAASTSGSGDLAGSLSTPSVMVVGYEELDVLTTYQSVVSNDDAVSNLFAAV